MIDKALNYDYLTNYGKKELEFIMMYMHQKLEVQRVQFLGHLANILIIFMPPCEVFYVLRKLVHGSAAIKRKGEQGRLTWHVPLDADDQSTLISSFMDLYLNLTESQKGERDIVHKCYSINMNFDLLVHYMFNSLLTDIMPLDIAIPIAINFLFEGVKVLFRYTIAAFALNRDFIL